MNNNDEDTKKIATKIADGKKAEVKIPQRLSSVEVLGEEKRFSTGIGGLDVCLAESDDSPAGLPVGTSLLISGAPGGGKSTITTFMSGMNIGEGCDSLILHGEERAPRVRKRWDRLQIKGADPLLFPLRAAEEAMEVIRDIMLVSQRLIVVVDSVQSLTLGGKRRPEHQFEAAQMICGLVTSNGGLCILVNHVDKTGQSHAGSGELPHEVDIHLHLTVNSKKSERFLEVRKNRMGRAGFQVPLNIGISSLSVGTPAPLLGGGSVGARNNLERAAEVGVNMLMEGMFLTGYDMELATKRAGMPISPGMWRAALEIAQSRLASDGAEMVQEKAPNSTRKGWRMVSPPPLKVIVPELPAANVPPPPVPTEEEQPEKTAAELLDMT